MPGDITPKVVQPGDPKSGPAWGGCDARRDTEVPGGEEGVWESDDRKTPERWVKVRTYYGDVGRDQGGERSWQRSLV